MELSGRFERQKYVCVCVWGRVCFYVCVDASVLL